MAFLEYNFENMMINEIFGLRNIIFLRCRYPNSDYDNLGYY